MRNVCIRSSFPSLLIVFTALCGAVQADHPGWPRTPPDYVREMGLTGLWRSVTTWKDGTQTQTFWHINHDVKTNKVRLRPCQHEKTTGARSDDITGLRKIIGTVAAAPGVKDSTFTWKTFEWAKFKQELQLHWRSWHEMRGRLSIEHFTKYPKGGAGWEHQGRFPTTFTRVIPSISQVTIKKVSRKDEEHWVQWLVRGKNLPQKTYINPEYPYVIRFSDKEIRQGFTGASTRGSIEVEAVIPGRTDLGPKDAIIFGRVFAKLLPVVKQNEGSSSGKVLEGSTGNVLKAALVVARLGDRMRQDKTDERGNFDLGDLPGGPGNRYVVRAECKGFKTASRTIELDKEPVVISFKLQALHATVTGIVVDEDDGRPIVRAEVTVAQDDNVEYRPITLTTDENGSFRVEKHPLGHKTVFRAQAKGFKSGWRREIALPPKNRHHNIRDISLMPEMEFGRLEGCVTDKRT